MNDTDRKLEALSQCARGAKVPPRDEMPPGFTTRVLAEVRACAPFGAVPLWSLAASCAVVLACWLAPFGDVDAQRLAAVIVQTEMPR